MTGGDSPADETPDPVAEARAARAAEEVAEVESALFASVREWAVVLVTAVVLALLARAFVLQAFSIPSESMETELLIGDRVIVDKITLRFGDVERRDIVVFDRPESLPGPYDELIKRVIGLPGETIEGRDGRVFIDGIALDEPYLDPGVTISTFGPVDIPEGFVFMMGDNRNRSADSRVFGPVPIDDIVGQARFRYWPLDRISGL